MSPGEEIAVAARTRLSAPTSCWRRAISRVSCIHMEICEDVWVPIPPSSRAALAGATVLLNLSASNVIVGKSDYRQTLCTAHSARCLAAYLYSAAGQGELTTDLAWDGEAMIYENGDLLAKATRFADEPQLILADIDLGRLVAERMRQGTFGDCADVDARRDAIRRVDFELPRRATSISA